MLIDVLGVRASTQHMWAPPLTEVLCYSALNMATQSKYAMEWLFDFYLGLAHMNLCNVPPRKCIATFTCFIGTRELLVLEQKLRHRIVRLAIEVFHSLTRSSMASEIAITQWLVLVWPLSDCGWMQNHSSSIIVRIIGASLSEPHTSVTALCMRVCISLLDQL